MGRGAQALSRDHKPNRADEQKRIEGAGGAVVWAGTWRVGGVLAVSRSFGNRMMKQVGGMRWGGVGSGLCWLAGGQAGGLGVSLRVHGPAGMP